jgi:hypothetical protein
MVDHMSEGFRILKADLASIEVAEVFAPLAAALGAALARAGAVIDATGVIDALMTVANQGAAVEDRLRALPRTLSDAAGDLATLDPGAMLATLRARHADVKGALSVHAGGTSVSLVRARREEHAGCGRAPSER